MQRTTVRLGSAALISLLVASCGGQDSGSANSSETISLSTGTQLPPMGYVENNELVGFEMDLGEALGEEMGVDIQWNRSVFSQFISDVESGRSDGVMGAILDTPERQETLTFVDYLESGFQFFTFTDVAEEHGISSIADFCGLTVAASRNSTYAEAIEEWSNENCGGDDISILATDGSPDALLQLRQGRVEGVMQTSEAITYMTEHNDDVVPVEGPITSSYYGLGLPKEEEELRDRLAGALENLIEDGTYGDIAREWGLEDQEIDEVTIDLEGR